RSINDDIIVANFEDKQFTTPDYVQAFDSINMNLFQDALKVFKNLRSYFEQNEREEMKDLFYEALRPEVAQYINEQEKVMEESYSEQLIFHFEEIISQIHEEVSTIMTHQIEVLNTDIDYSNYA